MSDQTLTAPVHAVVSPEDDPDFIEFAKVAGYILVIGTSLLEQHFGPRCPDFEKDCICCKRWKALDDLIDNPFAD